MSKRQGVGLLRKAFLRYASTTGQSVVGCRVNWLYLLVPKIKGGRPLSLLPPEMIHALLILLAQRLANQEDLFRVADTHRQKIYLDQ